MKTVMVKHSDIEPAQWRATYILRPDLAVLAQSLHTYGWIAPLIVRQQTNEIIDGNNRWLAIKSDPKLFKKLGHEVPIVLVKCSEAQAVLMHLQINRGRGFIAGEGLSRLVRQLLRTKALAKHEIMHALTMSSDEIDLMLDGSLLKQRKITSHSYSKAWVPIEAPASLTDMASVIERPPNEDR